MVCESCGHVSVHFVSDLAGEVERDRFARPVERVEGKHLVPGHGLIDDEFDEE
ncbi:MAG TPA: hypothetical protein VMS99_17915 [Acidimicrobiia bacterium]|nr:hypothetical protein [Acidimicrobiia bacterium]